MHEPHGVREYIGALTQSRKFGPQVVCHRTIPGQQARYATLPPPLSDELRTHLARAGIERLYSHQQLAMEKLTHGHDIIAATPTASGKSMMYNLPVVEMLRQKQPGTALYLFPLKALAQDQLRVFMSYSRLLPTVNRRHAAIYDGDTTDYQRRRIREEGVPVIMTNPEMLHLSLLPYHGNWVHFFRNLKYVVIDEVHTYRGVLGSHMAWILRRLQRVAASYGACPQFIMLSATIGNPGELAEKLVGRKVSVIEEHGAPSAGKHMVLLNPWDSAATAASQLLEAGVKRGLRSIVYTQSRKMTELINLWTRPRLGELASRISSYRAGFLPEERREIESRLATGELLGVITTSALELGIDIGNLDLCFLVGYPGSMMATWQRGGRVGRGLQESAVVLIAQEDALDQYFMRQPEDFFSRPVESASLNPYNRAIMAEHLHCACAELVLQEGEDLIENRIIQESVDCLARESLLLQSADGKTWFASRKYPQRQVSLRGSGSQLTIINGDSGEIIGEVDSSRAMKECHHGALYLHRAKTWVVTALDFIAREVVVVEQNPSWFTRPMSNKSTRILQRNKQVVCFGSRVGFGPLRVTEHVTGYQKKNNLSQKLIATYPLDLPEQTIETEGLWLEIPAAVQATLEEEKLHFMGAIHALEHAMIAMFPLLILCDRNDIGGISCPVHEQTETATIFIYDGHPGGIGLAEEAFGKCEKLLEQTLRMIRSCNCENGCPSCVHSPKCGSGNRPIDKIACLRLLELLFQGKSFREPVQRETEHDKKPMARLSPGDPTPLEGTAVLPGRFGVFDLETMRSAEEVGGWHRADRMGVSVAVVFDSSLDGCVTYLEHEVEQLIDHLQQLDLVVGFNNKRFDNQVLTGYSTADLAALPTLDLLEQISTHLGYRLSLDRLAEHTLGEKKSANGLQALAWYKEGRIDLIQKYCRKDVEITRDLLLFTLENGYLLFQNKAGRVVRLNLRLDQAILQVLSHSGKHRT